MAKTKKPFQDALTLISMWGFLGIALLSFNIIDLGNWDIPFLMIIAGGALFLEGEGLTVRKWTKDGLQGNEVAKLITIIVGVFSMVVGILALPFINITSPQLQSIIGVVAIFSLIFIGLERWIIN